MKNIFMFLLFYYYIFKRSPKKYDIAMDVKRSTYAFVVPLIMFPIQLIVNLFIIVELDESTYEKYMLAFLLSLVFWLTFSLATAFLLHRVRNEGYEIQREQERLRIQMEWAERKRQIEKEIREREQMERLRREQERREREQRQRHYDRQYNQHSIVESVKTAFLVLQIDPTSNHESIKKAYRRRAKQTHPDVGGSTEEFKMVKNAYDLLISVI